MAYHLGISTRIINDPDYDEERDALSREWQVYFSRTFPDIVVFPILNGPGYTKNLLQEVGMDCILLSNGNDVGTAEARDTTETRLIDYCLERDLPIVGVCRGMQTLNVYFGGSIERDLAKISCEKHVAVKHQISLMEGPFSDFAGARELTVNSYHNQGISSNTLAKDLKAFATTSGSVVEALFHPEKKIAAIQWHPERQSPSADFDRRLLEAIFAGNYFWLD